MTTACFNFNSGTHSSVDGVPTKHIALVGDGNIRKAQNERTTEYVVQCRRPGYYEQDVLSEDVKKEILRLLDQL